MGGARGLTIDIQEPQIWPDKRTIFQCLAACFGVSDRVESVSDGQDTLGRFEEPFIV
jgi:hypothetical protein